MQKFPCTAKSRSRILIAALALSWSGMQALGQTYDPAGPRTYVLPESVNGVRTPVVSLNGEWRFRPTADSRWTTVQVPGEVAMQGYAIQHDKPFYYERSFRLPADFKDRRTILRFDGVYSRAKLYVNGRFVREHRGGFTRWETDITDLVTPGRDNRVALEVEDRIDDISYAAGYAHHPIGGILRDVTVYSLPSTHLYDLNVETDLDSVYQNAELRLSCNVDGKRPAKVRVELLDPQGKPVPLATPQFTLAPGSRDTLTLNVDSPAKWDAEHPNLYTLILTTTASGDDSYTLRRQVGFREIEVQGARLLVNGRPVKLRGACRHDLHPTLGRTTTREIDSLDARLFKEANMNFVRTSHYPPNERFLDFCDRYGIYVESETAVCFVNTYRQKNYAPGASHNDLTHTAQYVGQCQEMVKSSRTHPSIIMWSIGNESTYGTNFQLSYDWVKANDSTRPVIFSYPGSVDRKQKIFDILSMHYQDYNGNLDQWGMSTRGFQGHGIPALFDEWAHPACYTYSTLQEDPGIREFWGQSLDRMWSGLFDAPGGLGGAIWGYVDETFALPEPKVGTAYWKTFAHTAKPADVQGKCVGYGEWGIIDVWRRPKPEFWSTKKAYSPVRLFVNDYIDATAGSPIVLTVYNRFDHTNLREITARFTYDGHTAAATLTPTEPHRKGTLTLPACDWTDGKSVFIEFLDRNGQLIDAYQPTIGQTRKTSATPVVSGAALVVTDAATVLTVAGPGFTIPFDKNTGLITNAKSGNEVVIERGPLAHMQVNLNHLSGAEVRKMASSYTVDPDSWEKESFDWKKTGDDVCVRLSGHYGDVHVDYTICIKPTGQLDISYTTDGLPNGYLRETGLGFRLPADVYDTVSWERDGYWNYYPEGEFAGNEGRFPLYNANVPAYGERPDQPWPLDTHNYYYWADAGANCKRPLTQAAKGMKENIYVYQLSQQGDGKTHRLTVTDPTASVACRLSRKADESLFLYVNNRWDYPEIAWGNYCKCLEALPCYGRISLNIQ